MKRRAFILDATGCFGCLSLCFRIVPELKVVDKIRLVIGTCHFVIGTMCFAVGMCRLLGFGKHRWVEFVLFRFGQLRFGLIRSTILRSF